MHMILCIIFNIFHSVWWRERPKGVAEATEHGPGEMLAVVETAQDDAAKVDRLDEVTKQRTCHT